MKYFMVKLGAAVMLLLGGLMIVCAVVPPKEPNLLGLALFFLFFGVVLTDAKVIE